MLEQWATSGSRFFPLSLCFLPLVQERAFAVQSRGLGRRTMRWDHSRTVSEYNELPQMEIPSGGLDADLANAHIPTVVLLGPFSRRWW